MFNLSWISFWAKIEITSLKIRVFKRNYIWSILKLTFFIYFSTQLSPFLLLSLSLFPYFWQLVLEKIINRSRFETSKGFCKIISSTQKCFQLSLTKILCEIIWEKRKTLVKWTKLLSYSLRFALFLHILNLYHIFRNECFWVFHSKSFSWFS